MSDTNKAAEAAVTNAVQADAAKVAATAKADVATAETQAQGFLRRNIWVVSAVALLAVLVAVALVIR